MLILWAVKKGEEDWQEQLITDGDKAKIAKASKWAEANGFDRLRVAQFQEGERPDFIGTIQH